MRWLSATSLAFGSAFAVMLLEIVGAQLLNQAFGNSLEVWTGQIGSILIAISLGFGLGNLWAGRLTQLRTLCWVLVPAGLFTFYIPDLSERVLQTLGERQGLLAALPALSQRLDPTLSSLALFLPPCLVLALIPPVLIRRTQHAVRNPGRVIGVVCSATATGSIAGVFASGYVLLNVLSPAECFQITGALVVVLALVCALAGSWFRDRRVDIVLRT